MIFNGKKIEFPAVTKISFFKVIEALEMQAKDPDKNVARFARELLSESEKYPELREGFEDVKLIEKHRPIIDRLSRVLFPDALLTNEIKGLIPPFNFEPFYLSTRFQNILKNAGGSFSFELKDYNEDLLYIYGASAILASYYDFRMSSGNPSTVEIKDKKANIVRSYRLAYNADLIEMVPTKKAPKITEEDYLELLEDYNNVELWKKKFPPNSYIMRGIGMANLMDVTLDKSLANITSNLLTKSKDSFERIMENIRNMFGIPDLDGGFVEFDNNTFKSEKDPHKEGMKSFILEKGGQMSCEEGLCEMNFKRLIIDKEPLVVTDTDRFHEMHSSMLSSKLKKNKKIGSYIIAPIVNNEDFLGFMEIVSPRKYELNGSTIANLDQILPIFSMAIARFKREAQNRREAIIQQECTTIHPSVKWRFDGEADKYMKAQFENKQPVFDDIVFKDVYPLYGQLDIKGSSEKRNDAIRGDLIKEIKEMRKVMTGAFKEKKMPVYEQLLFKLDDYWDEIRSGISSGSEHKIQTFLTHEINPVFEQLKREGGKVAQLVERFQSKLDPDLGTIYELRKKFDTSVNKINRILASRLDEKQIEAQKMFPHYFERYKTDGVEYNMYIGQSIAGSMEFNPVFLNNLRIWQLMVMCELENEFDHLKREIDTPLEIASLILVYNSSLSVHFRMDEKRFDVEGAYNARYEIVKKRVDKAHIKGTTERITAPGKIAIIYNSEEDARDYLEYIRFLQAKDFIKKGQVENLELEDLQGISGLKALRVEVEYKKKGAAGQEFSVDQLLEGMTTEG